MISNSNPFKKKYKLKSIEMYSLLILHTILTIVPFLWVIMSSLKDTSDIYAHPFGLPKNLMISNYVEAWNKANIGLNLLNSIIVCVVSVFFVLLISSMAAYILARVWKKFSLYLYFTIGIVIPIHTIIIPTFIIMTRLNLYNSRLGLILIYIVSNLSLSIFIMSGFMKDIPKELEEAARIDGCSSLRIFFSVILPLSKPGLATIGIFSFMYTWNDFLMANVLISKPELRTITLGIYSLRGQYSTNYGPMFAGMVIAIIPIVIIYLLFQEQVIDGMTTGAIKG